MKNFEGKVAIITGAAYGFGKEFVKQAAQRKMKIVAVDIMGDELAKLDPLAKEWAQRISLWSLPMWAFMRRPKRS